MGVARLFGCHSCSISCSRTRSYTFVWGTTVRTMHGSNVTMCSENGHIRDTWVWTVRVAGHVSSRHMSNSTGPPEWPGESSSASDKHKEKMSESEEKSHNTKAEKLINLVHEKAPEVYSLGQKLTEKSLSAVNSVIQTSMTSVTSESNKKKPEDWNDILNRWYQQYQDFVGITDLKKAQDKVTEVSEISIEDHSQNTNILLRVKKQLCIFYFCLNKVVYIQSLAVNLIIFHDFCLKPLMNWSSVT